MGIRDEAERENTAISIVDSEAINANRKHRNYNGKDPNKCAEDRLACHYIGRLEARQMQQTHN